jgi:dolichyl-phosphate beta-glucosyltransferase
MKLSVVIPAYNEETRIEATLLDVDSYLKKQSYDYEIIVVVNNSHDKTYDVVKKLEATTMQKATAMNLPEGGKGNAVKRGIVEKATGDIIMFMDADNATPISEIEKFLPYFTQGFDVVIGSRYTNPDLVKQHQPFYRILLSRLSNILIQFLAVPGIKDTQLGFKAFSKKAAQDIFPRISILRWGFDMEVLTIALAHSFKIKEVGVSWTEHGGGHVPLKAYVESLIDLLKIKANSISGKYHEGNAATAPVAAARMRDYDLAALAGFLTGICLVPVIINIGNNSTGGIMSMFRQHILVGSIIFSLLFSVCIAFGVWLGNFLSKWIPIMLQLAKFAAVGFLNTAINFGLLNLASLVTGITSGVKAGGINIPATIVAACNSYLWNKLWVFKRDTKEGFFHDVPKFALVTAIGILVNSAILAAFTSYIHPMFGFNDQAWLNIGKVVATFVGLFINFVGYKFLVFVTKKPAPSKSPATA